MLTTVTLFKHFRNNAPTKHSYTPQVTVFILAFFWGQWTDWDWSQTCIC